jgi:hypothetical protein
MIRNASSLANTENRLAHKVLKAVCIFLLIHVGLLSVNRRFPYLQSGADLVAAYKHDLSRSGMPFSEKPALKVMAFGNSVTLAGFVPALFDSTVSALGGPSVESYNFGLPADARFVDDLEAFAARGQAPDVALLLVPWDSVPPPARTIFAFLPEDAYIMRALFPYRLLPRNFSIALAESRGRPFVMRENYQHAAKTVRQVQVDRGYYFIARQSRFPNDELPTDFRDVTDTPDRPEPRHVPGGSVLERLAALAERYHITFILIPRYLREHRAALPDSVNSATLQRLAPYSHFSVAGPDYWRYPNELFSDAVHANRRGAAVYTKALAGLLVPRLLELRPRE